MIIAIFIASTATLLASGIYLLSSVKEDRGKQILTDLGLAHGLASPLKSPYYKWGWRKTTDDRVWGERIVREAFEKRNIGLNQQDLEFFSKACTRFAAGESIDKSAIVSYVQKILARSSSISNFASSFIRPILEKSLSASPTQAQRLLEQEKIKSSPSNAPDRLAVRQISKMLQSHGKKILCSDATGLEVKAETGETLMTLRGFDSWEFWLKSCKDSLAQCMTNKGLIKTKSQAKFLHSQIGGIINNYLTHLKNSRTFIKTMEQTIKKESLPQSVATIETLEKTFYNWHFSDGILFTLTSFTTLHDLIALPELPSRFRQALLEYITPVYESLCALPQRFPRHVIFMGSNPETRSYAAQQYIVHLNKLSKSIAEVLGKTNRAPLFLRILETDVEKARNPETREFLSASVPYIKGVENLSDNDQEDEDLYISRNTGHMPLLLDTQKRMILFERNLDPDAAEKMGWIIDLPIDDLTPKEYAQLDLGEYLNYKRINCDKFGESGHGQEGKSAQFHREKFLNSIFDTLLAESLLGNFSMDFSE